MRYLYMEQIIIFLLPISSSFPCQASCVDSKTSLVHAGHAVPRTLLPSWDKFLVISNFNCWWETFVYTKNVECWLPERFWVLIDHVLVKWAFTSYNQVLSCKQFGDFFLDRWEVFVLHASTKNPTAVEHFWILLSADWSCLIWMRWCRLEPGHLL